MVSEGWRPRTRAERQAVYTSRRWAATRRIVLDRAGWRCSICGGYGRLEVDHIKSMFDGGSVWAIDNLQALCRECHFRKTTAENRGRKPQPPEVTAWDDLVSILEKNTAIGHGSP